MSAALRERWFEDFTASEVFEFGDRLITAEEIVEFARRYDPQPFHVDEASASRSHFGGLVASGWMTTAVLMSVLCEHFISPVSSMGSPGVDKLRWTQPVRPGDRIRVRVTVLDTRRSQSKPDRGVVTMRQEALNQRGEVVLSLEGLAMVRCRTNRNDAHLQSGATPS